MTFTLSIYWKPLLAKETVPTQNTREADVEIAAREIAQLLQPLALLMSSNDLASDNDLSEETLSLVRDAWFNSRSWICHQY